MQNFQQNPNTQGKSGDEQDKSRQKNQIQRDIIMAETDYRKFLNEKRNLEMEIRKIKKDEDQLKIEHQDKQRKLGQIEYELAQMDNAIKSLKKKLNLI